MDTMNNPMGDQSCYRSGCCGLSWTAIIAGAFASIGLSILMNLLNVGLGFSIYAMGASGKTIAILTFIWTLITVYIAMFIAGLITGCLAKKHHHSCMSGITHGFIAWCVGLVFALILAAHLSLVFPVNMQAFSAITNENVVATSMQTMNDKSTNAVITVKDKQVKGMPAKSAVVNDETAAGVMAAFSLHVFLLLIVAAFATCLGAHVGIRCQGSAHKCDKTTTQA